ncbi:hypothetical protein [Embleya sp. NBC_00896]|uniref:hypothetical protein n=1 Tax=Embleya sp. NBC_00896 TaxID=2975961 RepID=UPI002F90C40E|nr:hypothetical protein OG928_48480 [Embleya sp. NBC_00896]
MLMPRSLVLGAALGLLIAGNCGQAFADDIVGTTNGGSGKVTCNGSQCTVSAGSNPGTGTPGGGGQTTTPVGTGHNPAGPGPQAPDLKLPKMPIPGLNAPVPPAQPGQPAPPAPPSPQEVAQTAVSQLQLPSPVIATNPVGEQIVGVPSWLWIDPASWAPVSATAEVPGVSVTATATPQRVLWTMGDGSTVTCAGPGTAYSTRFAPASASPDCGHTYTRSSATQPGAAYAVSATISWTVTWAGAGQTGVVPGMQTTGQITTRVAEVQAVVVNYRS